MTWPSPRSPSAGVVGFTGAQQIRVLAAHPEHTAFAPAPDVRVQDQDTWRAARDISRLIRRGAHHR